MRRTLPFNCVIMYTCSIYLFLVLYRLVRRTRSFYFHCDVTYFYCSGLAYRPKLFPHLRGGMNQNWCRHMFIITANWMLNTIYIFIYIYLSGSISGLKRTTCWITNVSKPLEIIKIKKNYKRIENIGCSWKLLIADYVGCIDDRGWTNS